MGQDEIRRLGVLETRCQRQHAASLCLGVALAFSLILPGGKTSRSAGPAASEEGTSPPSGKVACDTIEARWLKIVDESGHLRAVFGMVPQSRNPELSLRYANGKIGFKAGMHDGRKSALWLLDHEGQAGFRMSTSDDQTEPLVESFGGGHALTAGVSQDRARSRTQSVDKSVPKPETADDETSRNPVR